MKHPVLAHYIYVLRCCFYSSPKIKKLFERLYVGSLGRDKAYQRIWDLGKALTEQNLPLASELFEETSDAEVNEVIKAFLPLTSPPSAQSVAAVAKNLGFEFEPMLWQEAYDERGRALGIKHLKDHSDYSVSLLFPLPAAISEWKRRYPAPYWGCTPRRGTPRPSGVKGWAWGSHLRAWEADFAA